MTLKQLFPAIRAKRDQILDLELDSRTLEIAKRNAQAKLKADRSDDNRVTYHAIRAAISVYENGGAI